MTNKIFFMVKLFSLTIFLLTSPSGVLAGPVVVPHPKANGTVNLRDTHTGVMHNVGDELTVTQLQEMFKRARKIGDTISHLKTYSHSIDFSNRWLVNLDTGEIGMLRMLVGDVYQLEPDDLKKLQQIIQSHNKTSELSPTASAQFN
jgi:hypothetical protein